VERNSSTGKGLLTKAGARPAGSFSSPAISEWPETISTGSLSFREAKLLRPRVTPVMRHVVVVTSRPSAPGTRGQRARAIGRFDDDQPRLRSRVETNARTSGSSSTTSATPTSAGRRFLAAGRPSFEPVRWPVFHRECPANLFGVFT